MALMRYWEEAYGVAWSLKSLVKRTLSDLGLTRVLFLWCRSAGKTHFALQLCLRAQLPPNLGGLSGSAAFISSEGAFPSARLCDMAAALCASLSPALARQPDEFTDNVLLTRTEKFEDLEHCVNYTLPALIEQVRDVYPLRLVVVDSIAASIRSEYASSTSGLTQRGKDLSTLGQQLKALAFEHNLAVVVITQVSDVFQRTHTTPSLLPTTYDSGKIGKPVALPYNSQAPFFSGQRAAGTSKQAALGLAWANLVDTRLLFTRTGKRQRADEETSTTDNPFDRDGRMIRAMHLVYSPFAPSSSLNYAINELGLYALEDAHAALSEREGERSQSVALDPEDALNDESLWRGMEDLDDSMGIEEQTSVPQSSTD